jgi:hypothetical protein
MDEQIVAVPDDQWLIIHMPDQVYVWNLGQPDEATLDAALFAARAAVGFPADDNWLGGPCSLCLAPGRPHWKLMDRAQVGVLEQIAQVPSADVAAYRDAYAANVRQVTVESAAAALSALHPDDLAAVLEHPAVVTRREESNGSLE